MKMYSKSKWFLAICTLGLVFQFLDAGPVPPQCTAAHFIYNKHDMRRLKNLKIVEVGQPEELYNRDSDSTKDGFEVSIESHEIVLNGDLGKVDCSALGILQLKFISHGEQIILENKLDAASHDASTVSVGLCVGVAVGSALLIATIIGGVFFAYKKRIFCLSRKTEINPNNGSVPLKESSDTTVNGE